MMNNLKLPSKKVLAKHLSRCTKIQARNVTGDEICIWKCQFGDQCLTVLPSIWIQGTVVEVLDDGNTIIIDDGTGVFVVSQCDTLSSMISITKGMYVKAVGTLQSNGQCPVIKPLKLQDLSSTDYAETMWFLEVIDQMNFLHS